MDVERLVQAAAADAQRHLDDLVAARQRHAAERAAWALERTALLQQLATEMAAGAALSQQLQDLTEGRRSAERQDAAPARGTGARLHAQETARHLAELVPLKEAEREAVARGRLLHRQLREVRAELLAAEAAHATQRMQSELQVAQLRAEAAAQQALANRRAELSRPDPEREVARRQQRAADDELLAGGQAEVPAPHFVPAEWVDPVPLEPVAAAQQVLPAQPPRPRRRVDRWRR